MPAAMSQSVCPNCGHLLPATARACAFCPFCHWKGNERYRRYEVKLFLAKAKSLIESNPAPWTPRKMGEPPYPPKAMVILLLLKTWLGMDHRSISAYLRALPEERRKIGLKRAPSHTSIRNHMLRLPEPPSSTLA